MARRTEKEAAETPEVSTSAEVGATPKAELELT